MSRSPSTFAISSYAQEFMCFVGQQMVFEDGAKMLEALKGVNINSKQIERVCHHYGGVIEQQDAEMVEKEVCHTYPKGQSDQLHYAMLDGAMYLTREEKWKEAKIGRVFKDEDNIGVSGTRSVITHSQYVAHLGTHKEFLPKLEYHLDGLRSLVIVADGAKWIWNWADAMYPDATQILDFYHAKEHLCEFALNYFTDRADRSRWIEKQCRTMLEQDVGKVIGILQELPPGPSRKTEKQRHRLIAYYNRNRKRMRYSAFIKRELLIGSGAIESAHRNVLQQRMKLSGQRWTREGFQQVANLRVVHKSDNWDRIRELTRMAA